MVQKTRYIIRHMSGNFINLHYEIAKDIDKATYFYTKEEAEHFFKNSYYKTDKPDDYEVVPMRITYELESEVNPNVPQERINQEHCSRIG